MNIKQVLYGSKPIYYRGSFLVVPNWAKYLAVEPEGVIFAFEYKPSQLTDGWLTAGYIGERHEPIAILESEYDDWKDSLECISDES